MIEDRFCWRPGGRRLVPQFRFRCQCGVDSPWFEKAGYAHGYEAHHNRECWLSDEDRQLLADARELFLKRARAQHPSRWGRP